MKEKWGVSGVHGFLGSNLARSLEQLGHEAIRLDRTGFVPPQLDRIVDLAAYGNMYNQTDPVRIYSANVIRVIDILNNAQGVKSIILTSTSAVDLPVQTFYSASKKAMEEIALLYIDKFNLPILVIRPTSVYGPGEQKEHLIPKLIDSCLHGTKMPFVGEPVHSYIYIDDFVEDLIHMAVREEDLAVKIAPRTPFLIGSKTLTSNEEVKEIVEKVTGKRANIERVKNMRSYDTRQWPVRTFDLHENITLEEGIRRMVDGTHERGY